MMDNKKPLRKNINGYVPLEGQMTYEPVLQETGTTSACEIDPLKLYYLERLIKDCRDSRISLVFMASPQYKNTDASAFKPLMELCQRYHVPFINHYTDTTFNNKREYFIAKEQQNIPLQ